MRLKKFLTRFFRGLFTLKENNLILFLNIIFFISLPCLAKIEFHTINSLSKIFDYINSPEETLIVFDIDDTLITSQQEIGRADGRACMKTLSDRTPTIKKEYIKQQIYRLQRYYNFVPTEVNTAEILKSLISKKISVIGLTAREANNPYFPKFDTYTHYTLSNLALLLLQYYKLPLRFLLHSDPEVLFNFNIIFCGDFSKGKALAKFLYYLNKSPKRVIIIDDVKKNLHDITKEFINSDIQVICLNYKPAAKGQFLCKKVYEQFDNFLKTNTL